ncbi:MAG: SGNH/GDSL hydrolase family protein [Verrucomicrobiota bacterium]
MNSRLKTRLAGWIVLGALLIAGVAGYVWFSMRRPVGEGPAGPQISSRTFVKVWTTNSILLVGMGDSVTAGFGASKGKSYFDRLVRNPGDEFAGMKGISLTTVFPNLRATNLALSGSTSLQHLKIQTAALKQQPTNTIGIIVLTTGGNDIIHNYGRTTPREGAMYGASFEQAKPWIANFEKRLDQLLTNFAKIFPGGCHVFLANIYDPTDGIGDTAKAGLPDWPDCLPLLNAYNQIIARSAYKHPLVHLVNIRDPFLGHGIHSVQFWRKNYRPHDPHYWFNENLEDPNDRGYDALRRLFLIEIERVFRPVNISTDGESIK